MRKTTLFAAAVSLAVGAVTATGAHAQDGDAANGEKLSKRCIACHTFDKGGARKVGPNLWNIMDRGVAASEDFSYSDGLKAAAEKVESWDDEAMMAYLEDTTAWLRDVTGDSSARSKMTFKLPKEEDRRDVIAYMKTLSEGS
ncbi:c-type cytochrome [Caenispirillum salinarum]|uniref:c-type cytochrome n=1 Tax=Caenispirillum salinarum TaxID=859058 RepID=UPI00384CF41B